MKGGLLPWCAWRPMPLFFSLVRLLVLAGLTLAVVPLVAILTIGG